eukprot:4381906-Amphidinium_carterae.1
MVGGTQQGSGHPDDTGSRFKATPAKLPRLGLRNATDSSIYVHVGNRNWQFPCNSSLNTWGAQAVNLWQAAFRHTRQQHEIWCSYTPAQRALYTTGSYQGFQMTPHTGIVEA